MDAGTRFERLVADYLAGRLGADIDRQVKTGSKDTGDIRGVSMAGRGIAIECKDYQEGTSCPSGCARRKPSAGTAGPTTAWSSGSAAGPPSPASSS